jgi:hypothetical protein
MLLLGKPPISTARSRALGLHTMLEFGATSQLANELDGSVDLLT